jgi:hypothetical protein
MDFKVPGMITPNPKPWAHRLFQFYLKHSLLKDFHAVYLLTPIPEIPNSNALILAPNHSSWYDGFIPYFINQKYFQREFHILMLEEQLLRFHFFRKLGALGIRPDQAADIKSGITYMNTILKPKSLLVYFPQGKIVPDAVPEFQLQQGLRLLKPQHPTVVLPMRMHIESLNERKPALFISFGNLIPLDAYRTSPVKLEHAFYQLKDQESKQLASASFGNCIYGTPHTGL